MIAFLGLSPRCVGLNSQKWEFGSVSAGISNEANEKKGCKETYLNVNMHQSLTYQGIDTAGMQSKGTLVFHCYQILEGRYVTDQTAILKLIKHDGMSTVLIILPKELAMASLISLIRF